MSGCEILGVSQISYVGQNLSRISEDSDQGFVTLKIKSELCIDLKRHLLYVTFVRRASVHLSQRAKDKSPEKDALFYGTILISESKQGN